MLLQHKDNGRLLWTYWFSGEETDQANNNISKITDIDYTHPPRRTTLLVATKYTPTPLQLYHLHE